jgi:predicted membrane-bound mannosyltransferase
LLKSRSVSGNLAAMISGDRAADNPGNGQRQLWAILLLAAATRALYLAAFVKTPLHDFFRNDHLYYREWGLRIAQGQWLGREPFEQGPLYAYVLGALFRVVGPREVPVLCVQFLGGLCRRSDLVVRPPPPGSEVALGAGLSALRPLVFPSA